MGGNQCSRWGFDGGGVRPLGLEVIEPAQTGLRHRERCGSWWKIGGEPQTVGALPQRAEKALEGGEGVYGE